MTTEEIIKKLPFTTPYLFVDELHYVNKDGASGSYTFKDDLDFFKGHFNDYPVTPGAILIETMAQIGGACLYIYLKFVDNIDEKNEIPIATSYNAEFFLPVFPNEKVNVVSEIIYYRFGKLKYNAIMKNEKDQIVCKGVFSGMIKKLQ